MTSAAETAPKFFTSVKGWADDTAAAMGMDAADPDDDTFKARAPAVQACRAHDKKRLCTDQIHSSTRAHLHPDARQCPHRTDPEMTTDTR